MSALMNTIVAFAHQLRFEEMPEEVISESKRLMLDSVGCALAAHGTDKGRIAVQAAREMGAAPEASIIGAAGRVSFSSAAFANGELISTLDYDALTSPPGHVAPYVIPALLASVEKNKASGKSLILALAAAHELSARFGSAMADVRDVPAGQKISFPAVTGYSSSIFGGTLGTAMLAGLDAQQTASALGLAGHIAPAQSMGKWVRTLPATTEKYLMAGWINQAELLAVLLAKGGYQGDASVLDGDFGFSRFMGSGRWNPDALVDRLGVFWKFPSSTIYKPYPHCRISQTVLDCLAHLIEEHSLQPDEIDRIDAWCDPHGALLPMWSSKELASCLDAQMSVPYAVSLVAHRVKSDPGWQNDATMKNPRYVAFMDKVTVQAHPHFETTIKEEPGSRIGKVDVFARGRTFTEERKYRKGSPATPQTRMSDQELLAKFYDNAAVVLPADVAVKLGQMLLSLEDVQDASELSQLWSLPASS